LSIAACPRRVLGGLLEAWTHIKKEKVLEALEKNHAFLTAEGKIGQK